MFTAHCKRLHLLVPTSVTHFHSFPNLSPFTKSYSSLLKSDDDKPKDHSFTVSYLVDSLGFSPKLALKIFKTHKLRFNSPEKPDSVIKLLKNHGFDDTQIPQMVKMYPCLLMCNAEKILQPKLEFLGTIGLSPNNIAEVVNYNQRLLAQSLEKCLKPFYDLIKSVPIPDEKVPVFFKNSCRALGVKLLCNLAPNINVLREVEVPESSISFVVIYHPLALSPDTDNFRKIVDKIIDIGISPSSFAFIKAIQAVSQMNASKWNKKKEFFLEKCGWTEDDFLKAFRKNPLFVSLKEKKCLNKIEFLVNEMGWQPSDVAAHPDILTHSLEKSVMPRCSVIRVLEHKGLIEKGKFSPATLLINSRKQFLDRFVIKYEKQAPELLSIFQGQMSLWCRIRGKRWSEIVG
ncbi:uncharacterized protein LOC126799457 [Argentina anserina]|uniref:uncharacterized protein LOC126799457 n=1 Tax=Argentina anserina TaxID=57926 RepID=UPI0021768C37|nr:uncharacterized protein LOC126799457 [Potentilla anserina]